MYRTTCMKHVQKHFSKENLCALQVFLCVPIARPVCAHRHEQPRGNSDGKYGFDPCPRQLLCRDLEQSPSLTIALRHYCNLYCQGACNSELCMQMEEGR